MAFGKKDKNKSKGKQPFRRCNQPYKETIIQGGQKIPFTKYCQLEAGHSGSHR